MTHALQAAALGASPVIARRTAPQTAAVRTSQADRVQLAWNPLVRSWPRRPAGSSTAVLFVSTGDASAPPPSDFDLLSGDVWWRHPASPRRADEALA